MNKPEKRKYVGVSGGSIAHMDGYNLSCDDHEPYIKELKESNVRLLEALKEAIKFLNDGSSVTHE